MATAAPTPPRQLSQKEADIQMMLAAEVHLGTKNCDFQMERYVFKRRNDGIAQISVCWFREIVSVSVLEASICMVFVLLCGFGLLGFC